MQIRRNGGYLTLRDRAPPFWGLGLFLLAGGVFAVAMPLGLASNAGDLEPWERLASIGVGLGVIAGALWWLARSPATKTELDLTRRRLRLVRLGLGGRHVLQLSFDDVEAVFRNSGATTRPAWRRAWPVWQRHAGFRPHSVRAPSRDSDEPQLFADSTSGD